MAKIASASDRDTASTGSAMTDSTRTAIRAEMPLPITADQGWARGLFGTAKSSTAEAPKGAIRISPSHRGNQGKSSAAPKTASARPAPTGPRARLADVARPTAGPNAESG